MSKERFEYIDALRGFAIAAVIFTHAAQITALTGRLKGFAALGSMGVQLFFVISAFTIFFSLSRSDGEPRAMHKFFIKRLFRIVPVYWLGILLYSAVYGLQSRGWLDGPELWHYPLHIFLVNVLHPLTTSSVVPGGWSISCEVLFYAVVPILYTRLKKAKDIFIFLFASVIIFPVFNQILQDKLSPVLFSGIGASDIKLFWYRWMPNQLGSFGFGILLFYLISGKFFQETLSNKSLNLFVVLFIISLILLKVPQRVGLVPYHYTYSGLFMCLALLLSQVPWTFIVNRFTIFLGKISYSCYLIHFLILKKVCDTVKYYMPQLSSQNVLFFFTVLIVSSVITIAFAYLSYTYIEKKSILLGKKLINSLNSNPARIPA